MQVKEKKWWITSLKYFTYTSINAHLETLILNFTVYNYIYYSLEKIDRWFRLFYTTIAFKTAQCCTKNNFIAFIFRMSKIELLIHTFLTKNWSFYTISRSLINTWLFSITKNLAKTYFFTVHLRISYRRDSSLWVYLWTRIRHFKK